MIKFFDWRLQAVPWDLADHLYSLSIDNDYHNLNTKF